MATVHQPTPIQVERRFPLDLHASLAPIRQLYEAAKAGHWNPQADVPWASFSAAAIDGDALAAAARVWSRRAWVEYTGLAATPALLIRFCLELDREADPKYFLSVRNTEEAWHIEVFHRYAQLCGGYLDRPANAAWEPVFNRNLDRDALNASMPLDAYVAVHCAYVDGLELELARGWLANATEPVARAALQRLIADYDRHAQFGWLYLESRLADADAAQRAVVAEHLVRHVSQVEFAGYHCPSVAQGIDASADNADADRASAAGLGVLTAAAESALFVEHLGRTRARLAALGVTLPTLNHARLGAI